MATPTNKNCILTTGKNCVLATGKNAVLNRIGYGRVGARSEIFAKVQSRLASRADCVVPEGWELYSRDIDSGTVTRLGFINAEDSPLELIVAMADGTYDIEARPWGWYWRQCRTTSVLRVVITGGVPTAATLPPIRDLRADPLDLWGRDIRWSWDDAYGVDTPANFGVWISDVSPVVTTGAPDAIVYARHAGAPHVYRYAQSSAKYAAVAARDSDDNVGPVSEIELDYPSGSITSPDNQWATEGS